MFFYLSELIFSGFFLCYFCLWPNHDKLQANIPAKDVFYGTIIMVPVRSIKMPLVTFQAEATGFLLSRICLILQKTEDQKGARFPNTTPLSQMPTNSHTQILAPLSAASLTASHIPSYGHTATLVSLLSSALSKPRCLDTALSSLAASINKLKAQGK